MWQSMTLDEYADLESRCGSVIRQSGEIWWRRVRPFLYRPLNPLEPVSCRNVKSCFRSFTAIQHPISQDESANSYFNLIVFDQLDQYRVEDLHRHHRRYLREAIRNEIELKLITDSKDIPDGLHEVYLAFYKRSQYTFSKNRLDRKCFNHWLECHLDRSKAEVIVAFHQNVPVGIYITCLLCDTLIWKTAVNSPAALELRAQDVVLHQYHEQARKQPEIKRIFCGYYGGPCGLSTFKLRRGAKIVTLPAHLRIRPFMLRFFKTFLPSAYQHLVGFTPEQIAAITSV
jgi:hypothetical protein